MVLGIKPYTSAPEKKTMCVQNKIICCGSNIV